MAEVRTLADMQAFANSPTQEIPSGHALARPTQGIVDRPIGAQQVAVMRDEQKILKRITTLAAAAGSDWFYRFPVKKKDGGQDWIEGPSIKLALAVAGMIGNNHVEIRELDVGDAWVFYARYTDIETGFSLERAYRQRKGQQTIKTKDADRSLDIVYQVGQSKAIRNVIVNACGIFCDFAFEQAQGSLVEKIGKSIEKWRDRTLEGIGRMPCELTRVERVVGRASKDWTAPDIARIVSMMQSVADGMATIDDVFPPIEKEKEEAAPAASKSDSTAATEQKPETETDSTETA